VAGRTTTIFAYQQTNLGRTVPITAKTPDQNLQHPWGNSRHSRWAISGSPTIKPESPLCTRARHHRPPTVQARPKKPASGFTAKSPHRTCLEPNGSVFNVPPKDASVFILDRRGTISAGSRAQIGAPRSWSRPNSDGGTVLYLNGLALCTNSTGVFLYGRISRRHR